MLASKGFTGLVTRAAKRHLGKATLDTAGVLSTAQRHTHFLNSHRAHSVLDDNNYSFADLKQSKASVFLILPLDRLYTYSRWMRLIITQSLIKMARSAIQSAASGKQDTPVI